MIYKFYNGKILTINQGSVGLKPSESPKTFFYLNFWKEWQLNVNESH